MTQTKTNTKRYSDKNARHSRAGGNLKPENINTLITENLDIWTSAIKSKSRTGRGANKTYELYGIKKLRELILDLAVRGLLVPQDPNEEPASELLKKIAIEKEQLIKEGKRKKQKPLTPIGEEEKPFELPENWVWTRFGGISEANTGFAFKSSQYKDEGIFVLRVINIDPNGVINHENSKYISRDEYTAEFQKYSLDKNDLLLVMVGGSLGKVGLVSESDLPAVLNQNMWKLDRYLGMPVMYMKLGVKFINRSQIEITKSTHGHLSQTNYLNKLFPLPPLNEQKRIVAKVDELMALCDQLEQQTDASIKAHKLLVKNLLNALTQAKDHKTFQQAWHRISKNFDTLFTTEHSIDQLKQTILQLAIMGKLVPQDPNDEPASELLKKIAAEKEKLIKEGKIKKQKPLPEITEDEKPFELPEGWEWEKVANFTVVGTGSTPSRTNPEFYNPPEFNWVTSGETNEDFIFETKEKVSKKAINETNVSIYPKGSLIVAMYGQGKTRGQISELMIAAGTNQACAALCMIEQLNEHRQYIKLYFKKAYKEIRLHSAGGAQPNLNVGKISSTFIPMPPLNEQKRIVAKVDELVALCDQMKSQITSSKTIQKKIADTLTQL